MRLLLIVLTVLLLPLDTIAAPADTPAATRRETRKPPALKPGDGVALVAPAGPVETTSIRAAIAALERAGYVALTWMPAESRRGYLAGSDEARVVMLNAAIRDPNTKAILCLRGGYGTPRILDRIDYAHLRSHPKPIIGYSDITALLLAVRRETGLIAFHGPMGVELASGLSPFSTRHLWGALNPEPERFQPSGGRPWGHLPAKPPRALAGGVAEGPLVGGNLSLVCATMGTRWEIETKGCILFLEDVNEKAFRIDRMLAQLRLAGKLAAAEGILLGSFSNCGQEARPPLDLEQVFADYFKTLGVPVLAGYPAGHQLRDHATLPLGVRARLDADRGTLSLLESPVAE